MVRYRVSEVKYLTPFSASVTEVKYLMVPAVSDLLLYFICINYGGKSLCTDDFVTVIYQIEFDINIEVYL